MSDTTPRNDALLDRTAGISDAAHLVKLDVLSRALERELAAANAERDILAEELRGWAPSPCKQFAGEERGWLPCRCVEDGDSTPECAVCWKKWAAGKARAALSATKETL